MTPRTWAEKKVQLMYSTPSRTRQNVLDRATTLLHQEHARSVRSIKKRKKAAYLDKHSMNADQFDAYIAALDDVYSDIMKGRL